MISDGNLWLIPVPIGEEIPSDSPEIQLVEAAKLCGVFIVEKGKTARKWLKWLDPGFSQRNVSFIELNKHGKTPELERVLAKTKDGVHIGLISEAGCPGVADPGAEVVSLAHKLGICVRPLVGPSSIILALMASGLPSQKFSFHSYLPVKTPELKRELSRLESISLKEQSIQLFIETPYRNEAMFSTLLETLRSTTLLCLALGLQTEKERIFTFSVAQWKKHAKPELHKIPCVFLIMSAG